MFKPSLILIAACLALSSAEDPRHLGWAAAKWRIQRKGTPNPHLPYRCHLRTQIDAGQMTLNTITNGTKDLKAFPDELQERVAQDYEKLKSTGAQEVKVSYGYSERTGFVIQNNPDSKFQVSLLKDKSMVMISLNGDGIANDIRIIVPPSINYGELGLQDNVDGGCLKITAENIEKFMPQAIASWKAGKKNIEIPITSSNATAKYSYTSRQGADTERLTLAEALTFEDDAFVAYFKKSFQDFADIIDAKNQGAKHHIHIEWMPIRRGDLDKTVIEWILIDSGYEFDKKTNEGDGPKRINGKIIEIDEELRRELNIETAEPGNTLISPVCPDEGDRSPIALQVCPVSREMGGTADNGDEHCANIRNFMLQGSPKQVKTVWAEVGRQARKMVEDTDQDNPLRIWTIGGSIGWLHIKMCRDFRTTDENNNVSGCARPSVPDAGPERDPLCKGWATQCATAQARRNNQVAWHHVFKAF